MIANLLDHRLSLLNADRRHLLVLQARQGIGVIPQIDLGPHEQLRCVGAVVGDFRVPFGPGVLEGRWRDDGEANEKHIGLRRRRRDEEEGLFHTGIPKAQVDCLVIHHHVRTVVIEN